MYRKSVQKVFGKLVHDIDNTQYSRVPVSVLHLKTLSITARCVYAELALHVYQGRTVKVGQRKIAANLGIQLSTVNLALRDLVAKGCIIALGTSKLRRTYVLPSHVFAQKQGRENVVVSGPSGGRRLVSVKSA